MKNIRWHLDEGGGGSNLNPRLTLFSECGRRRWEQRPEPSKWNNLQILTFGGNLRGREGDVEAKKCGVEVLGFVRAAITFWQVD